MDEAPPTLSALLLPTVGTLLVTGAAVGLLCPAPRPGSLSWVGLATTALGWMVLAGAVHAGAVFGICRIFREQGGVAAGPVAARVWWSVAWLPGLMLLLHEDSIWGAVVLPVIVGSAALFVRRRVPATETNWAAATAAGVSAGLFDWNPPLPLVWTLLPAVLVSIALEAGVGAVLAQRFGLSGVLFAAGMAVMAWVVPVRWQSLAGDGGVTVRKMVGDAAPGFLLLMFALLPFLVHSRLSGMMALVLRVQRPGSTRQAPRLRESGVRAGGELSGVILTLPPKPREKRVPPSLMSRAETTGAVAKTLVLPFDGAYWYFRSPETHPRRDAKRVLGDPLKVEVRSTDRMALQMEAHQRLEPALSLRCCSAIRVAVRSANDRSGSLWVELVLEDGTEDIAAGKAPMRQTLGWKEVMSRAVGGAAAEEVLTFPVPATVRSRKIDAITVMMHPAWLGAQVGAHVRVERFELVP